MPRFKFAGPVGFEGEPTGDGRLIARGALRFAETMPLMFVRESQGGHAGAVVVGHFTEMLREGDEIIASGEFVDPEGAPDELAEDVRTAILLVAEGHAPGVSMDLGEITAEFRVAKELLFGSEEATEPEEDEDGRITLMKFSPDDEIMVFTDALVRGATLVSVPAFANARLEVLNEDGSEVTTATLRAEFGKDELISVEELMAEDDEMASGTNEHGDCGCSYTLTAAAPVLVESGAFANIPLKAPTPLTVENGKVFGHIALWDSCHVGFGDVCVSPPSDPTGEYAAFRQTRINTDAGIFRVGVLTVGGGHADPKLGPRAAVEHYDNVGTAWAYVTPYEDEFGIMVRGVVAEGVDDNTLATALAHPVSGDWRNLGGGLELVACCSVNTPGFPVLAASAEQGQTSLVASSAPKAEVEEVQTNPMLTDELAAKIVDEIERREKTRALESEVESLLEDVQASLDLEAKRLFEEVMG